MRELRVAEEVGRGLGGHRARGLGNWRSVAEFKWSMWACEEGKTKSILGNWRTVSGGATRRLGPMVPPGIRARVI